MAKLTKDEKIEQSKALAEALKKAPHLFFTEYQGMKFGELDDLRNKLRPLHCKYAVIKNSLVKYALKNAGVDGVDPKLLKGPIGMVVADNEDPVAPAKILAALSKQYPNLKVKAGYVGAKWMTPADCAKLSTLPGKQELMGKVVNVVYSVVSNAVAVVQAPTRDAVMVVKALAEKKQKEGAAAA